MLPTLSPSANRLLVAIWIAFASFNVILMWLLPGEETIPFHFVWISMALVYGFTWWRRSWMVLALLGVVVSTGVILAHHAAVGEIRWEETAEEPLMTALFVVLVWHVHRHQVLLREVGRIHEAERRRLERQQQFVRLASHELRTPITVARGYTELLRAEHTDEASLEDTEIVLDELDKVTRISQRLVTLMQLDEPHPLRYTDLDGELLRIVRRWTPTADRAWAAASTIGVARLNPDRFEAALDCLIENAIKFTRPGDEIEINGRREPGGWTVEVRDSGTGIGPEAAEELLSGPPAQGTSTGTGLGLTIVRAVAESLAGHLTITGAPGAGTRVCLHVPQPVVGPHEPVRLEPAPPEPVPADPQPGQAARAEPVR